MEQQPSKRILAGGARSEKASFNTRSGACPLHWVWARARARSLLFSDGEVVLGLWLGDFLSA